MFHSFKLHSFRDFNLFLLVLIKISLDPLKSKVHKIAQMVLIFWLIKIAQRWWIQWCGGGYSRGRDGGGYGGGRRREGGEMEVEVPWWIPEWRLVVMDMVVVDTEVSGEWW